MGPENGDLDEVKDYVAKVSGGNEWSRREHGGGWRGGRGRGDLPGWRWRGESGGRERLKPKTGSTENGRVLGPITAAMTQGLAFLASRGGESVFSFQSRLRALRT